MVDDYINKTRDCILNREEYLEHLRLLCTKTLDPNVSLSEFTDLDYILLMISKVVVLKEKYILKKSRTRLLVDYSLLTADCKNLIMQLSKMVDSNYPCSKIIEWENLPVGLDQSEIDKIVIGINVFNDIRNAIGHGSFRLHYGDVGVRKNYLELFLSNSNVICLEFEFLKSYLMENFSEVKDIEKDEKKDAKDSLTGDDFDNSIGFTVDNDDRMRKMFDKPILSWFHLFCEKYYVNSKNVLEKYNNDNYANKVINEFLSTVSVASKFGINVEDYVSSVKVVGIGDNYGLEREAELLHLIRNLSKLIKGAIQDEFKTPLVYSYSLLAFSTSMDLIDNGSLLFGLMSTSEIDVSVFQVNGSDKTNQYLDSINNIIDIVNDIDIDNTSLEDIVYQLVDALSARNEHIIRGLRNSVDHLNIEVINEDGEDKYILSDKAKQTDEGTKHFEAKLKPEALFNVANNLITDDVKTFTLHDLFSELVLIIYDSVNVSAERKEAALFKIRELKEKFNTQYIDFGQSVIDFCPNLISSLGFTI